MTNTRFTACTRDCPDACSVVAHVEQGRVLKIQGDPNHPVTKGFLCERTSHFQHRLYSPHRLTTPLLRKNGVLVEASWDEALAVCAETLLKIRSESGASAIFHYRSGGSLGLLKAAVDYTFSCFGPVTEKSGDICSGAGEWAQVEDFGDSDANDIHEILNSTTIVLWGKNPYAASAHLVPILKQAKQRKIQIAVIDPVNTKTSKIADLILSPRPGGDIALALGLAKILFDSGKADPNAARYCDHLEEFKTLCQSKTIEQWALEADLTPGQILELAKLYSQSPASILVGWGMQRRTDGASIVRCIDALCAISGNLGVSGGGVSFYCKRRGAFDQKSLRGNPPPRTICEPLFAEQILAAKNPEIRAIWITAGNPVVMLPDSHATIRAIESREFVVVVDQFLTDTARLAHVILPATTFLEEEDLIGSYGHHYLSSVRPVVPPVGSARSDYDIAYELAKRLGLGELFPKNPREMKQTMLGSLRLENVENQYLRSPASGKIAFEGRKFNTQSGKVNLIKKVPVPQVLTSAQYPLQLMALSHPSSQCSQWIPDEPHELVMARVHPESAIGLSDGAIAGLESELGSIQVRIHFDESLRKNLVVLPKGGSLSKLRCANALVRARLTDEGQGAALYEEAVRLVRSDCER